MLQRANSSPKRIGARRDRDLYYYYAAFDQSFIEHKLLELNLPSSALILDPWCGSGTTLAAAHRYGHRSLGFDINPVSVVLSKSRFASPSDVSSVVRTLRRVLKQISLVPEFDRQPNMLLWTLRNLLLRRSKLSSWSVDRYASISPRDALLLTALFFFARHAARFTRSKNPSWRKNQTTARLTVTELKRCHANLLLALQRFKKAQTEVAVSLASHQVLQRNNETDSLSSAAIADVVITSPPYLTRLDYGVATGIEWRLLEGGRDADLTDWRASFTGSVLTYRSTTSVYPLPRSVADLLSAIQRHDSKAARTYYFQFFRNYFVGIQNAIGNISDACKLGARGLFVVQDSQFKDLNIPLTRLFSDMLECCGWKVEKTEPFSISPTFYKINAKRWAVENFVRSENLIWARRVI